MSDKKALGKKWRNVSLSHATMRNEDLIPAFFRFLEEHDPKEAESLLADYPYFAEFAATGSWSFIGEKWYLSQEADYLCMALFTEIDAIAPDGYYFGAHPGDGSDYGFWECEEI